MESIMTLQQAQAFLAAAHVLAAEILPPQDAWGEHVVYMIQPTQDPASTIYVHGPFALFEHPAYYQAFDVECLTKHTAARQARRAAQWHARQDGRPDAVAAITDL
jgi:hypothetical protein